MCARFNVDDQVVNTVWELAETKNPEIQNTRRGDVGPSDHSMIVAGHKDHLHAGLMIWGIPRKDGKGLIINARSETAMVLPMFQSSMLHRRCLVPAKAFYEWDAQKNKITFSMPEQSVIFLAGIYEVIDGQHRYTILTTEANASVSRFHNRMPVILSQNELKPWLFDSSATQQLIGKEMPQLEHHQEYEQVSLF